MEPSYVRFEGRKTVLTCSEKRPCWDRSQDRIRPSCQVGKRSHAAWAVLVVLSTEMQTLRDFLCKKKKKSVILFLWSYGKLGDEAFPEMTEHPWTWADLGPPHSYVEA